MEEILDARRFTRDAAAPPPALGWATWADCSTWVVDLTTRFQAVSRERLGERCVLIVRTGTKTGPRILGLLVDGAVSVVRLNPRTTYPLPLLGRPTLPCVAEVIQHGTGLVPLVSVGSLLAPDEADALAEPPPPSRTSASS